MKKLFYATLLLAAVATGCAKTNNNTPTVTLPTGNFTGQFLHIRKNPTTSKLDTIKANLDLSLSSAAGFAITGDTTLHAGSHGGYAANAYYMQFADQTVVGASTTTPPAKYHLNGIYYYQYNGSQLNIYVSYADTLSFQYMFKKN